jgi:hypothetical protein
MGDAAQALELVHALTPDARVRLALARVLRDLPAAIDVSLRTPADHAEARRAWRTWRKSVRRRRISVNSWVRMPRRGRARVGILLF